MSDLGDLFREWKKESQAKKASNAEQSLAWLERMQIPFKVLSYNNHHTLVADRIDFWPSTGKWRERGTGRQGRGVRRLMDYLKRQDQP